MEFFRGKTLIFKEFFRGEQRFHGIFREKSTFSRISSGVDPFLREVFRGECSLVEFFRGKKKSYSSTGGGGGGADIKCNSPMAIKIHETDFRVMPFERNVRHIRLRYRFFNSAYFVDFIVTFQWIEIDCVLWGFRPDQIHMKGELYKLYSI